MKKGNKVEKEKLAAGIDLLQRPVLPLVSMLQFFMMTGPFEKVEEVIAQLPEPIETGLSVYDRPREQLSRYLDLLRPLERLNRESEPSLQIVGETGEQVDSMTARIAIVRQHILQAELETINSLLCAPCQCTLCCIGPDEIMDQEFFEIPLQATEQELFSVPRYDSSTTRRHRSTDATPLDLEGQPFYAQDECALVHWRSGWSLILPRGTVCPNMDGKGRCTMYTRRPDVCRRPQIFPYILEPVDDAQADKPVYRLRSTILAIVDCPYVKALKEEIEKYAAACECSLLYKQNKG